MCCLVAALEVRVKSISGLAANILRETREQTEQTKNNTRIIRMQINFDQRCKRYTCVWVCEFVSVCEHKSIDWC